MRQSYLTVLTISIFAVAFAELQKSGHDHLSGLQADIVIAIDSSSALSEKSFKEVKSFVKELLHDFHISQNGVRVALYHVGGDTVLPFALTHLNGITSHRTLATAIGHMEYDGKDGHNLNTVIKDTTSAEFRGEGYRTEIDNHLFLYITGSSFADGDAVDLANAARRAGGYGYITIAYKAKDAKSGALKAIAGGNECFFAVNDEAELNGSVMTAIRNKIIAASENGGIYC